MTGLGDEISATRDEEMSNGNARNGANFSVWNPPLLIVVIGTVVISLVTSMAVKSNEVEDLQASISKLEVKLDNLATKDDVEEAQARAVEASKSYTNQQVSALRPELRAQTELLQRIDRNQQEIKQEQRQARDTITELKVKLSRE